MILECGCGKFELSGSNDLLFKDEVCFQQTGLQCGLNHGQVSVEWKLTKYMWTFHTRDAK